MEEQQVPRKIVKPNVVEFLKPGEKGIAKIDHFVVSEEESRRTSCGRYDDYVPEGHYARLWVKSQLMMTDTPYEWRTNKEAVYRAHGDVLIAGLGIGMILVPILQKPEVRVVWVVERSLDVIELVENQIRCAFPDFSPKLIVVPDDIFTWRPVRGFLFNTIYFDIWDATCGDNVAEMSKLKRGFARKLDRKDLNCWVGCWEEDKCRRAHRQETQRERLWG